MTDSLEELSAAGVAIWLDDLSRERLTTGNLASLIAGRHVVGVTSNPTIFQKALEAGSAYDAQTAELAASGADVDETVRALTTADIRDACDVFLPTYELTEGVDGRVSIEVDPRLARDTDKTLEEARALWELIDRPNLFIKIPATVEGLPAITSCIREGISVNVTLIFSLERYRAVMDAYATGLEQRQADGNPVTGVDSVASFFVSRVDSEVDNRLDLIVKESGDDQRVQTARRLRGEAAIANARLAYQAFEQFSETERWQALKTLGASPQRPLWASTGVKDPAYDDTRYVAELVAPGTVNTMPEGTLDAFADHGTVRGATAAQGYDAARSVFDDLEAIGIGYDDVVDVLENEGVQKFEDSWQQLLDGVQRELARLGEQTSAGREKSPASGQQTGDK
jgi:transaldolase